jgi:hypothetical protein
MFKKVDMSMPPSSTVATNTDRPARLSEAVLHNIVPIAAATVMTLAGILIVNPHSLMNFSYYLFLFCTFIFVFHKDEMPSFLMAFTVNSALISVFYIVQTTVYPESFGTSSPLGSQTDDSFFFALTADSIPPALLLRENYSLYTSPYSDLIRFVSFLPIHHPMDVIFFQSGVAAILTTFLRRFTIQHTGDIRLANIAYFFALFCPFLLMNGGALLIRDTLGAALLIYSLACLNKKQWPLALAAIIIQVAIRPGTGLILLPVYYLVFLPGIRQFSAGRASKLILGLPIIMVVGLVLAASFLDLTAYQSYFENMSLSGRDYSNALQVDQTANKILLSFQEMPFLIRFFLNGAYIFLYPFLSVAAAFPGEHFDLRSVLLSLVAPAESFWLNAWFIAGLFTRVRVATQQRQIGLAVLATFLLIGTYSMQTRHKTIIYPLYYFIVAIGFAKSEAAERRIGYAVSTVLIVLQILAMIR